MCQDALVKRLTMTRMHTLQRGVTLVELMIALAIGLLIVLVVTSAYLSGIGTQRAQTDITRLEESARFSFDLIARAVRRAGYRDIFADNPPMPFCADKRNTFASVGTAVSATNDDATVDLGGGVSANVVNNSDTIRVRYYGEDSPATPGTPDGVVLDCLGNAVARNTLVRDTIYVAADAANNGEPTLFCNTDNPSANPKNLALIPGIESMQLLYADENDDETKPKRYLPPDPTKLDANRQENGVGGLIVSVVVRTPGPTGSDRSAKTFSHFGAAYAGDPPIAPAGDGGSVFTSPTATDGRVRMQFSNFISLRNAIACVTD